MGLHLNFELRLPSSVESDDVTGLLHELHRHAQDLQFPLISDFSDGIVDSAEDDWRALFRILAQVAASEFEDDPRRFVGDPASARGFLVHPGRGCEPASIGFLRRTSLTDGGEEWFWYCRCKTQYASVFGEDYFVECHTRLIALIDQAGLLGADVVVRDEGHYWETRDRARLLEEVRYMNRVVARLAGAFHDRTDASLRVGSPIFDHPDFERLETES